MMCLKAGFVVAVLLCAGAGTPASAGQARLLKDINTTHSRDMGSFPGTYLRLNDVTLFRATTRETGIELWRTDGTGAGTSLVKDIWPGPASGTSHRSFPSGSSQFDPVIVGDVAFFLASDGVHGWELWKSDGSEAGTSMVKEIRPGPQGPFDGKDDDNVPVLIWMHVEVGGRLYFAADDGVHGFELWRTDGTEAGTLMLRDILPGPQSAFGSNFSLPLILSGFRAADAGGALFFSADDGVHGSELWKTDGRPEGTLLLKEIATGPTGSDPRTLFDLDDVLLFWAGSQLWRSDGTEAGTWLVRDSISAPQHVVTHDGFAYFTSFQTLLRTDGTSAGTQTVRAFTNSVAILGVFDGDLLLGANDGIHGFELWKSDGTPAGTTLFKDIAPGSGSATIGSALVIGGRAFFSANDGVHGMELWTSDGTEAGTHLVADFMPGPSSRSISLFEAGGSCYVTASDDGLSPRLWITDGTPGGTRRLKDLRAGFAAGAEHEGVLLIGADDGSHGVELWKSDGTEAGTVLVKDVHPLVRTEPSFAGVMGALSSPGSGERVLLVADDEVHGREVWVTDGTSQGTRLLKDIKPGPGDSSPGMLREREGVSYFFADDGIHGQGLWRTDGTEAGTVFVEEFPTEFHSPPVELNGLLYFIGDDQAHGWELWRSDLTAAGTFLVAETIPGPNSSIIAWPFKVGDTLYFTATSPLFFDDELWKSDGTQAGTVMVKDSAAGDFFFPNDFAAFGDRLFLTAFDFDHGWEPWLSDGTEAGTQLIRDIQPGFGHGLSYPTNATEMGGSIYFAADDGAHSQDLWKSDGTETGTTLVKDLRPASSISGLNHLVEQDGTLYFTVGTSSFHTRELWRSDGTQDGTLQINPDLGSFPYGLHPVPGGLVFTAWDPDHGYELWRSDGTAPGTALAQDIAPGPLDSRPQAFTVVGHRTFFLADDGFAGYEPWVARTAILMNQPVQAIHDLRDEVTATDLARGPKTGLLAKLDLAARALEGGRPADAVTALEDFGRRVDALTPRFIPETAAANLREFATEIIGLLEP